MHETKESGRIIQFHLKGCRQLKIYLMDLRQLTVKMQVAAIVNNERCIKWIV